MTSRSDAHAERNVRTGSDGGALFLKNISKSFGAQRALDGVTLTLKRGENHALLGSNGAGKSTLGWLLAGRFKDYGGTVFVSNQPVRLTSRRRSLDLGIEIVTQEPALALNLSVADNLTLGSIDSGALINRKRAHANIELIARDFFADLGLQLNQNEIAKNLPLDQRQIIDLLRAVIKNPAFLIIDEPPFFTDAKHEIAFRGLLGKLCSGGTGVLLITHHIEKALSTADTVTVIRDGRIIASRATNSTSFGEVFEWMFQQKELRARPDRKAPRASFDESPLSIRLVELASARTMILSARPGRVVGLKAAHPEMASGVLRSVAGIERRFFTEVVLDGRYRDNSSPRTAKTSGIFYLSSDREREASFPHLSVKDNLTFHVLEELSQLGVIDRNAQDRRARALTETVEVRSERLNDSFSTLSGGNQQRILLGRMIAARPVICLLDEPNRGIDAASLLNIRGKIHELASNDAVVLIASTDEAFLDLVCDDFFPIQYDDRSSVAQMDGGPN
jgi:ABC-type sugar transport system ATPase subunit